MTIVELYRYEADRLRSMALAFEVPTIREALLDIARQYDILADKIIRLINGPEGPEP